MIGNSISKKVMTGYTVILFTVLFSGIFLFQQSSYIGKTNEAFIGMLLPELQAVESISTELNALQLSSFALYGTTINITVFERNYKKSKAKLKKLLTDSSAKMLSEQLPTRAFNEVYLIIDKLRLSMRGENIDWDGARTQLELLQAAKDKLDKRLDMVKSKVQEKAHTDSNTIQQQIVNMHSLILSLGILLLLIIIAAFYISRRGIVIPAKHLSHQIGLISSSMDLTNPIEIFTKDELLDIANALNCLLSTFRSNAETSKVSAQELMVSAESLEQLSSTVKSEIEQFSSHIYQLNEQVSSVENNIMHASEKSQMASGVALTGAEQAESGAEMVNNAARGIDELNQDLQVSSDMLTTLKQSGVQVSAVVKTIAEIAEQTNLLALNAAIEAARAGETGRGFAVVADEVRLLATRTHDSTHQINEIIESILKAITDAVDSMESNQIKAKGTVESVHQTVASLEELRNTILQLSDDNQDLAQLTQSNEVVIKDMRDNIAKVISSNQTIADGGEEVHEASNQLMDLSSSLTAVSNKFKT